jgi:outer membrane receptor protein involved in Fe transport
MNSLYLRRIFILSVIFISTKQLRAQQDTLVGKLDSVVVSAQRIKQQVQQVPFSTTVLQQSSMQKFGARTTPEALSHVNGVFVQKTNHGGGSPFLRGLTGNQTLILVDGIRLNSSIFRYGPNQYLNTIDPFSISRIEVVKGTGSVQYGTDALGGTILLETNEREFLPSGKKLEGKALGRIVTHGMEQTARGAIQYADNKIAFEGGLTWRNFGDLTGGDTTGKQTPSGYGEWAFDAKAKMLIGNSATLTLAHQTVQQNDIPIYHKVLLERFTYNNTEKQNRSLSYARLHVPVAKRWAKEITLTASRQKGREDRRSLKQGSTTELREGDEVETAGLVLDINSEIRNWWQATSGMELYHDWIGSRRSDFDINNKTATHKRGLYPDGANYGNYSVFSLHHFNWNRFTVEAGLRFNTFSIAISDSTLGKVRLHPSAFVYNAGVLYRLTHRQSFFANYSTGYRAPNVDDMGTLGIVDFRYERPSADLSPEKSQHAEIGYRLLTNRLRVDAALYFLQLENLITRVKMDEVINGYNVYQKENVEEALVKGAEVNVNVLLLRNFSVNAGAAYAYGKNITRNEPLRRTPPFNGRMMLEYKNRRWRAAFEFAAASRQDRLAQGDKEDNRIPAGGTPGWQVFNLYAGYDWKNISINAGLNNLNNQDYRTHGSGINEIGRSAWCSVMCRF